MRREFYSICDGGYAQKLFDLFGRDRVEYELNQFLSLPFVPRFGGGIGVTRLVRALNQSYETNHSCLDLAQAQRAHGSYAFAV
jgi:hypothetical protein